MSQDRNYVSVGFWMFALFIIALPCVGWVMILYWAFAGENESRKNYFRALIAWAVLMTALWVGLVTLGFWPEIRKAIETSLPKIQWDGGKQK